MNTQTHIRPLTSFLQSDIRSQHVSSKNTTSQPVHYRKTQRNVSSEKTPDVD